MDGKIETLHSAPLEGPITCCLVTDCEIGEIFWVVDIVFLNGWLGYNENVALCVKVSSNPMLGTILVFESYHINVIPEGRRLWTGPLPLLLLTEMLERPLEIRFCSFAQLAVPRVDQISAAF